MILEQETINVLKNFSRINNGIYIRKDSGCITTMGAQKNILAEYRDCQSFPVDVALFDLTRFISVISSFDSFELEFTDKYVTVVSGQRKTKVYFADLELLIYPTKSIVLPNCAVEFTLTSNMVDEIAKMSRTLDVSDIRISNWIGTKDVFCLQVLDSRNDTSSSFEIDLGTTDVTEPFEFFFSAENLKILPTDYDVRLSNRIISEFSAKEMNLKYWIAMNRNSVPPGQADTSLGDGESDDDSDEDELND